MALVHGNFEEVSYPGKWPTGAPVEHKVKSTTKITTKTWPPDSFFQQSEADRAERIRLQEERARREEEVENLRREAIRRQEALEAFDRAQRARALAPPRPAPPMRSLPDSRELSLDESPQKLTTKVVVKKWPPDSWFEDARKKAHAPRPKPKPVEPPQPPREPSFAPQPSQYGNQQSPSYPVGQNYPQSPQSDPYGDHRPIPLDPNSKMYNPHGFWPYAQGQPPKVQPAPAPMRRLREEMPMMMPETVSPQQQPYPDQYPPRQDSRHGVHQGAMQFHQSTPMRQPSYAPPSMPYTQEQEEMFELGEHFQCLGCGCHIRPSEVVYRPRTVPCLPPPVEHTPVPLQKPDGRPPVVLKPPPPKPVSPPPQPRPVQLPRMPSLQLPPEPPREELAIKDVEPFDFEKARREGQERAKKEKEEEEYKIKTVENFDFEAARQQAQPKQPEPEPERVKIIEDFDFEGARRAGQQQAQPPRPATPPQNQNQGKIIEDFDFDAARRQPPQQPAAPQASGGFDVAAARAKVQAVAAARYVPDEPQESHPRKSLAAVVEAVVAAKRLTSKKLVVKGPPNAPPRTIDATTDDDNTYCCICMRDHKASVILPCRHLCMCMPCSGTVQECPLCRAGIQQRIEVFV